MDDQSKMEGSAPTTNVKIVAQSQTARDVDEAPPDASLQSNDVVEIHAFLEVINPCFIMCSGVTLNKL